MNVYHVSGKYAPSEEEREHVLVDQTTFSADIVADGVVGVVEVIARLYQDRADVFIEHLELTCRDVCVQGTETGRQPDLEKRLRNRIMILRQALDGLMVYVTTKHAAADMFIASEVIDANLALKLGDVL